MKRLLTICAVLTMVLAVSGVARAEWTGAVSVREETFYVPSTGLTLGDWFTVFDGQAGYEDYVMSGYAITENFQINMEYQPGILDKDIANINTYLFPANAAFPDDHTDGTWTRNYSDPEVYVFNIDLAGGLTLYEYEGLAETTGGPEIQWTITGWHQTILAGSIVGNELVVVPTGTYRPFVDDPPVNNVEVFSGDLRCEVLAYTFTGDAGDIGSGTVLGVATVPAPGALVSGLALLGGCLRRRYRR